MKVLIDSNVVLNILLKEANFYDGSIPAVTPEEFIKAITTDEDE